MAAKIYGLLEQNQVALFVKAFSWAMLTGAEIEDSDLTLPFVLSVIRVFGSCEDTKHDRMNLDVAIDECRRIRESAQFFKLCQEQRVEYPVNVKDINISDEKHSIRNAALCFSVFHSTALKIKIIAYAIEKLNSLAGVNYAYTPWNWRKIS